MTDDNEIFSWDRLVLDLENQLNFPEGTIQPIFSRPQEEWVFVLKVATMAETVLKSALFVKMTPDRFIPFGFGPLSRLSFSMNKIDESDPLRKHITKLPFDGRAGIIALAKDYDLIRKEDEDFIREITGIRNRYAHSILKYTKTVREIVSEDKNEKQIERAINNLSFGRGFRSDKRFPTPPSLTYEIELGASLFLVDISCRIKPLPLASQRSGSSLGLLGDLMVKPSQSDTAVSTGVAEPDRPEAAETGSVGE